MGLLLLIVIVGLIVAEFAAFAWVAEAVGVLDAVALLFLVSLVGAWLTKRAGLSSLRRLREADLEDRAPDRELAGGLLILLAGVLLVVPGFVTGALGALLLLPPIRALASRGLVRQFGSRSRLITIVRSGRRRSDGATTEVWDVESWEEPPRRDGRKALRSESRVERHRSG